MAAPLTAEQANAAWDALVKHAGANDADRDAFVVVQVHTAPDEYRFQGALGFGGKFWNYGSGWCVTCYPEDANETRLAAIDATNEALAALKREAQ